MKASVKTTAGKTGIIDIPFYPTKRNFDFYKNQNPNLLIEIILISSGETALLEIKKMEFISKMDLDIPRKRDWDL
jgi:hypothetical protein